MFVQPDSDIQCLLGVNIIPFVGIRVERANGEVIVKPTAPEPLAEARVYLINSARIQAGGGTVVEAKIDMPITRAMNCLLFEPDEEFFPSVGMVSVDALLSSTNEGKVLVPLENYLSLAADLDSGTCIRRVTIATEDELTVQLVETTSFIKKESKEPQSVEEKTRSPPQNELTRF